MLQCAERRKATSMRQWSEKKKWFPVWCMFFSRLICSNKHLKTRKPDFRCVCMRCTMRTHALARRCFGRLFLGGFFAIVVCAYYTWGGKTLTAITWAHNAHTYTLTHTPCLSIYRVYLIACNHNTSSKKTSHDGWSAACRGEDSRFRSSPFWEKRFGWIFVWICEVMQVHMFTMEIKFTRSCLCTLVEWNRVNMWWYL